MSSVHPNAAAHNDAERAAQAIVDLINSRPRSPRADEIATIIKQLAAAQASSTPSCPHCNDPDREYGPVIKLP
jgi:hypothetical protein